MKEEDVEVNADVPGCTLRSFCSYCFHFFFLLVFSMKVTAATPMLMMMENEPDENDAVANECGMCSIGRRATAKRVLMRKWIG